MASPQKVCCSPDLCAKGSSSSASASADFAVAVELDINEDLRDEEKLKSSKARIPAAVLNPMNVIAESSIAAAEDDEVNHSRSNLQSNIEEKVDDAQIKIMRNKKTYARNDDLIYNLLHLYAVSVPVIVAGILSSQHIKKGQWLGTVILSGLVSGSIIAALILSVFEQFGALKHGQQFQQQRDSDIDSFSPKEETSAMKRSRFPNYGKDVFEETSAYYWGTLNAQDKFTYYWYWWGSRSAFLLILISTFVCVMLICCFDAYI